MRHLVRYYLKDAFQGMRRNAMAFTATVILIALSLSLMGSFLLVKQSANGVVSFLETQVKIKVFVADGTDSAETEKAIRAIPYVSSTEMETKEELLKRMEGFFDGKEYLFDAFESSDFPYTILIEATDETRIETIVGTLEKMEEVEDIVYPQTFAKEVLQWTERIDRYGLILLGLFLFISFLTTQLAIALSMHQRKKEIDVKLLLGAKPVHVRNQFLFEGWVMGFVGSVLASVVTVLLERYVMTGLYQEWPVLFDSMTHEMNSLVGALLVVGSIVGIFAAYLSTKGRMKNA